MRHWFVCRVADVLVWLGYCASCKAGLNDDDERENAMGRICRPCFEASVTKMNASVPVFAALLRAGVERSLASKMMSTYLEHGEDAR